MRLDAPVTEHAVTPAERRVLVDADHDCAATDREPALHAPEESAPAIRTLQVVERRAGEDAERAAAVATAEALSPGEMAPFLDADALAVDADGAVAKPSTVLCAEGESEVGKKRGEGSLCGHDRDDSPGRGAEE